jgi:predicted RNase H-like nuclease (RuvC/YqgF family)
MNAITITLAQSPQVSLFGVEESEANRMAILSHAVNAITDYIQARDCALKVCLRLYQCRQSFTLSGEKGWESFCKHNFHKLGLSQAHIRNAVAAGRTVFEYIDKTHQGQLAEGAAGLEKLSMSALVMMSSAPEEVRDDLIKRITEKATASAQAPTAKAVGQEVEAIKIELAEARGSIGEKDAAIMRLSNQIRDRDQEAADLRNKLDAIDRKFKEAQAAAVTVVDADPRNKKLREEAENLENELLERRRELDRIVDESRKAKEALAALDSAASSKRMAADSINRLDEQIREMKARWTDVFVSKLIASDRNNYGPVFERYAKELRVLADQFAPDLISK